jgi:uncharacterized protein YycO
VTYTPGDYFVVRTGGWAGALIRTVTRSRVNHAGLIIRDDGTTVEAQPKGARYGKVPANCYIVHVPYATDEDRYQAVNAALACVGVGYNWTGLAALAAAQYGLGWLPGVKAKLASLDNLFCSQLVDYALHMGHVEAFDDGRAFGDVSPGDLLDAALQNGWTVQRVGNPKVAL